MKKIVILCLVTIIVTGLVAGVVTGCQEKGVLRLNEVTHSIFYAPLYVAINNGYFSDEGIEIELTNGGGSDKSMTAVMSGDADIGLMGPETAVYVKAQGANNNAVIFGQLTKKDGSFLIARQPDEDFSWSDVASKEVIGGRQGGMPAMCLEDALIKAGLNKKSDFVMNYDVQFNLVASAFESGTGDYCTMFEPTASEFQKKGKGYIVASVGEAAGEMPYTCFIATKSYIKDNRDRVKGFLRAVLKGIDYVCTASDEDIVKALKPSFPGISDDIIAQSVNSYKSIDAYMVDPVMTEESFNNLVTLLRNMGTLEKQVTFGEIVDNSIVKEIAQEKSE